MKICQDCQKPIEYGRGWGGQVCSSCRGKRAAKVTNQKRAIHGPHYTDRRSDARREAL